MKTILTHNSLEQISYRSFVCLVSVPQPRPNKKTLLPLTLLPVSLYLYFVTHNTKNLCSAFDPSSTEQWAAAVD